MLHSLSLLLLHLHCSHTAFAMITMNINASIISSCYDDDYTLICQVSPACDLQCSRLRVLLSCFELWTLLIALRSVSQVGSRLERVTVPSGLRRRSSWHNLTACNMLMTTPYNRQSLHLPALAAGSSLTVLL